MASPQGAGAVGYPCKGYPPSAQRSGSSKEPAPLGWRLFSRRGSFATRRTDRPGGMPVRVAACPSAKTAAITAHQRFSGRLFRFGIWRPNAERCRRPCLWLGEPCRQKRAVREFAPRRSPCLAAALPHARPARIPPKMDRFRSSPIPWPRSSRSCRKMSPRISRPKKSFARSARKPIPCCTSSSAARGPSSPKIGA